MISQRCPKCLSNRVRRGYRPTPFWSKVLFRYNLLCDNCNWEFKGFAVPGTVSAKPTRTPKKKPVDKINENLSGDSTGAAHDLRDAAAANAPIKIDSQNSAENDAGEKMIDEPASRNVAGGKTKAQRKSGI